MISATKTPSEKSRVMLRLGLVKGMPSSHSNSCSI